MAERQARAKLLRAYATCWTCGWELESNNAVGVAAQHARRYGHQVDVEVTRNIRFDGERDERRAT